MSNAVASEVLVAGMRTEFADTYLKQKRESDARLGLIMDLSVTSDKREEIFGYWDSAPHAEWWQRGEEIPQAAMPSTQFRVLNLNWGKRIKWHADDRADDMTGTLMEAGRMCGRSFSALPERFAFDYINASPGTLPQILNAPDGVPLWSAVDGRGEDRFGVPGGNVVSASGAHTDPTAIRNAYYQMLERFKMMKDAWGQPLHDDQAVDGGVIIVHGAHLTQEMEEAFIQKRVGEVYDNASTAAAATPTNLVHDAARNVTLWGSQRMPGNNFSIFLRNPPKKALALQTREGLSEKYATMDNSDHARNVDEEYLQWKWRGNGFVGLPYGAGLVDVS